MKYKKSLFIIGSAIIIIIVVAILFISPITKYLVEKYDEKYVGRQITMDWAYINPFTGYIHLNNLKIYEQKGDSVFFSTNAVSANIAMLKLLSRTYEISEISLDHPRGIVIQNKKDFNFNDLIEKFSAKASSDTTKAPIHLNILNIKINDGQFFYREELIPINYFITNVNFESPGKRWDIDTITAKISFLPGIGSGDIKGDFTINFKSYDYRFAVIAHTFDLNIIEQYLKDLANYGSFSANIDADMKATGNLKDEEDITAQGQVSINDFHLGKNKNEDYASFDKMVLAINEVSPMNHKYFFDSVSLSHPFLKYELYDHLDNLQTMFGKNGSKIKSAKENADKFNLVIEIANYIKVLSKNFFHSHYKINRFAIYKGDLKFNDYSLSEKFSIDLNPLSVIADSVDKNHKRVNVSLKSGIKPFGNVAIALSINPKDSVDFDLHYHFKKLPVPMFNPYIISYTSFPLDRGTMELKGKWNVKNSIIQSDNHLVIVDPRVTKRIRNRDTKWIPIPLIMSFIRERGNVIDYEIPITGNLKNPKFHLQDAIFDMFENIFVKPATTQYRMEVKNIETEIEKSLTLKWQMRQNSLRPNQEIFIDHMADYLIKNPETSIAVHPLQYEIKEKEYILFFEAKKKYFLSTNKNGHSFSEADSEKVENMSVKDSLFVNYLNKNISDHMLFTIQEKCERLIAPTIVNAQFNRLNKERKAAFIALFKEKGVENRVKIHSPENTIPYNGFSFYKIDYKGEIPRDLKKAYQEMNELDNEAPRKEFLKKRKENKS